MPNGVSRKNLAAHAGLVRVWTMNEPITAKVRAVCRSISRR